MTKPRKQCIRELLSKFSKDKVFLASEMPAVYTHPVVDSQQYVACPECFGSGYGIGYYIDRYGDMQENLCNECFGDREMTQEEHDHVIARNPELAWRLSCLDLIAERLRA